MLEYIILLSKEMLLKILLVDFLNTTPRNVIKDPSCELLNTTPSVDQDATPCTLVTVQ